MKTVQDCNEGMIMRVIDEGTDKERSQCRPEQM